MHCYHRLYLFIVFIDYHKNNPAKKYQIFKGKTQMFATSGRGKLHSKLVKRRRAMMMTERSRRIHDMLLHVFPQTLPGLKNFAADGAGGASGLQVVRLDVELDVLLHLYNLNSRKLHLQSWKLVEVLQILT